MGGADAAAGGGDDADAPHHHPAAALRDAVRLAFARGTDGGCCPREHQIRAVGRVLRDLDGDAAAAAADELEMQKRAGVAHVEAAGPSNYLLQHSAGSGKSLTIACLAAMLVGAVDADAAFAPARRRRDLLLPPDAGPSQSSRSIRHRRPLNLFPRFDLVIVLSDRIQLDEQLGSVVQRFLLGNGMSADRLCRPRTVAELRDALARAGAAACAPDAARAGTGGGGGGGGGTGAGTVILSTLQKFPKLTRGGGGGGSSALPFDMFDALVAGRMRVGLIADEAHRSHGAASTEAMHALLGGRRGGLCFTPPHLCTRPRLVCFISRTLTGHRR